MTVVTLTSEMDQFYGELNNEHKPIIKLLRVNTCVKRQKLRKVKIIITIKITWHLELGKGYRYKSERTQNHDTKQAIEQWKEIE